MSLTKVAGGAMILRNIRWKTLLDQATASPGSGHGLLGGYFSTVSTPPTEGGSEGVGEKAKQTMENVVDAAKDTSRKLKDRVMGSTSTGGKTEKPISNNPDLNHGVESTDSSCEDVRDRPGGYS